MKNKIIKFFLSGIIIVLLTIIMINSNVYANNNPTYITQDVTVYVFGNDKQDTFKCLFRDDLLEVPFVNVIDFFAQLYTVDFTIEKKSENIYILSCENGNMEIDVKNDKVYFDEFESFIFDNIFYQLESSPFVKEHKIQYDGTSKPVNLDLGKYNLDVVEYNGNVYMPLPALNDIVLTTYSLGIYLDGNIYFTGFNDDYYFDAESIYEKTTRSQTFADFSYDELCFAIDYFYGKPTHSKIANGINEKGLDAALDEYAFDPEFVKDLLKSTDYIDYFFGLAALDPLFDDGGHTSFTVKILEDSGMYPNSYFTKNLQEMLKNNDTNDKRMQILEQEGSFMQNDYSIIRYMMVKDDAFEKCTLIKKWKDDNSDSFYNEPIAILYQYKDTAIFSFDSFNDNAVYAFKEALDYADSNKLNNFIIDLTTNSGGNDTMVSFMISIMTQDTMNFKYTSTISNNKMKQLYEVDKNLDGVFDEKDNEVKYNFNFAILESSQSFSCGNLLPCLAKENGIAIMGEKSGGGSCAISLNYTPNNYKYGFSGIKKLVNADGTDVDMGAIPDLALVDGRDLSKLYDFDTMISFIEEFYKTNEEPEEIIYDFIEGTNQTYTQGKDETTFKINAYYSLFKNGGKVFVDDKETTEFVSKAGSTIITLNKDFVNSLSIGEHTLRVTFNDGGEAITKFTIAKAETEETEAETEIIINNSKNPKTGDNISMWIILMLVLWLGIIGTIKYTKKIKL